MKKDLALPWKVVTPQEKGKDAQISTVDGFHIASINRFAESFGNKRHLKTAHDVVRAVNNHDALLEACKWALSMFDYSEVYDSACRNGSAHQGLIPALKKAIANAEK